MAGAAGVAVVLAIMAVANVTGVGATWRFLTVNPRFL